MPVGTYTVSIAKLGQLMRVALAKLPLRGDGTRSARELGEYLTEVGTLRPALSEAELFVCRLDPADFDCVSRRPVPLPPAAPPPLPPPEGAVAEATAAYEQASAAWHEAQADAVRRATDVAIAA
eukprot:2472369-Pleurochrysis_carterae.AAC.1